MMDELVRCCFCGSSYSKRVAPDWLMSIKIRAVYSENTEDRLLNVEDEPVCPNCSGFIPNNIKQARSRKAS